MKIFIFVCLFLSTLCSTTPLINDIEFNTKYPVYYGGIRLIPRDTDIYLRMKILENDKMQVSLETYTNYFNYFGVRVSCFQDYPYDDQIVLNKYYGQEISYEETEILDGGISTYVYPFDTPENSKYLGVHIHIYNDLGYLDITVISVTGLIWLMIVGGVVVFIALVIGGIFGIRKYRR